MLLHLACPRVEYTDRGKSAVVVRGSRMDSTAIFDAVRSVTGAWARQRKAEEREASRPRAGGMPSSALAG